MNPQSAIWWHRERVPSKTTLQNHVNKFQTKNHTVYDLVFALQLLFCITSLQFLSNSSFLRFHAYRDSLGLQQFMRGQQKFLRQNILRSQKIPNYIKKNPKLHRKLKSLGHLQKASIYLSYIDFCYKKTCFLTFYKNWGKKLLSSIG